MSAHRDVIKKYQNEEMKHLIAPDRATAPYYVIPGIKQAIDFDRINEAGAPHYKYEVADPVFVKDGDFFRAQGGLRDAWGSNWIGIVGKSLGDARRNGALYYGVTLSHLYSGEK